MARTLFSLELNKLDLNLFQQQQAFSAPRGCQARFVRKALLCVFDAFGKYQEQDWVQFIETAQQRYMLGSHWTVLAWQDSPVWTATCIGNLLLSAHHKVAFDLCAFGHPNRKLGCFVSSSNVYRRLRWTCCRHQWPHAHLGKQAITQHLPPAFVDVFTAAVASLASSPFLVTRVACAVEPGFPCQKLRTRTGSSGVTTRTRRTGEEAASHAAPAVGAACPSSGQYR